MGSKMRSDLIWDELDLSGSSSGEWIGWGGPGWGAQFGRLF